MFNNSLHKWITKWFSTRSQSKNSKKATRIKMLKEGAQGEWRFTRIPRTNLNLKNLGSLFKKLFSVSYFRHLHQTKQVVRRRDCKDFSVFIAIVNVIKTDFWSKIVFFDWEMLILGGGEGLRSDVILYLLFKTTLRQVQIPESNLNLWKLS